MFSDAEPYALDSGPIYVEGPLFVIPSDLPCKPECGRYHSVLTSDCRPLLLTLAELATQRIPLEETRLADRVALDLGLRFADFLSENGWHDAEVRATERAEWLSKLLDA